MVSASQSSIEYVVICDRSALQYCIYPFKSMFFSLQSPFFVSLGQT